MISGRALHYVFKIGDRLKNAIFFREILAMKVRYKKNRRLSFSNCCTFITNFIINKLIYIIIQLKYRSALEFYLINRLTVSERCKIYLYMGNSTMVQNKL